MGNQILLVDDDIVFNDLVREYLENEGFTVHSAYDGDEAIKTYHKQPVDIIILDVMMPNKNGFDTLKVLRKIGGTPVLMLTAKGDDLDRILGLELGADDYLSKPCNLRELTARIKAILRRVSNNEFNGVPTPNTLVFEDIKLDLGAQNVWLNDELNSFTSTEFLLLKILVEKAGQVVEKELLSKKVLGRSVNPMDRSLDVHIGNIRKKLGPKKNGMQRIKTARGKGYFYVNEQQS